ncbi:MAG TPA: alpha/beta hydrolase [Methylibium sp.]|nr:alpha/beta hydrolase [Methylibium sp.]
MSGKARRFALRGADARGAARLATDATAGLTDLVEAVHARILRRPGSAAASARTGGLTGQVYQAVRGVTRVAGGSLDALLGWLPRSDPDEPSPSREALLAALNGVLGDHLAATGNPLATTMAWRRGGRPLRLEAADLPDVGGRLLVLIHGLCMNDLQWLREGHDHGAALARDLGYTPVYLHYNSGLHVSTNGQALAQQLECLLDQWPWPVQRLVLLGHSMGGLLARSALHQGALAGQRWVARVDDLVCLGTPHHGAPLERAGHGIDLLLGAMPYAAPFARLGKLRSAGITDLRHGSLLDADWAGRDRFARGADTRQPVPLPAQVRCHALAACVGPRSDRVKDRLIGDGLVPLDSALGRHRDPAHTLGFAADRQWVGHGIGHLALLNHPEVYAQLRKRLA